MRKRKCLNWRRQCLIQNCLLEWQCYNLFQRNHQLKKLLFRFALTSIKFFWQSRNFPNACYSLVTHHIKNIYLLDEKWLIRNPLTEDFQKISAYLITLKVFLSFIQTLCIKSFRSTKTKRYFFFEVKFLGAKLSASVGSELDWLTYECNQPEFQKPFCSSRFLLFRHCRPVVSWNILVQDCCVGWVECWGSLNPRRKQIGWGKSFHDLCFNLYLGKVWFFADKASKFGFLSVSCKCDVLGKILSLSMHDHFILTVYNILGRPFIRMSQVRISLLCFLCNLPRIRAEKVHLLVMTGFSRRIIFCSSDSSSTQRT